jgi:hypothetical protein
MGVYTYSIRTRSLNSAEFGKVFACNYLGKRSYSWYPGANRILDMQTAKCEATWDRRNETPQYVYMAGDDDRPRDGDRVIKWAHGDRVVMSDTESFGETLGFLRKVGRKWTIVPSTWNTRFNGSSQGLFFSVSEAMECAASVGEGQVATIEQNSKGKSSLDCVSEPTPEEVKKVQTLLSAGSWPCAMWKGSLRSIADYLVSCGRVRLTNENSVLSYRS